MSKKQPYRRRSFLNITNEDGTITPILVKDYDDVFVPEHKELFEKAIRKMHIRCAKFYAEKRGYDLEILDEEE